MGAGMISESSGNTPYLLLSVLFVPNMEFLLLALQGNADVGGVSCSDDKSIYIRLR